MGEVTRETSSFSGAAASVVDVSGRGGSVGSDESPFFAGCFGTHKGGGDAKTHWN